MADISVTATSVVPGTAAGDTVQEGLAGATITAGQPLYKDSTDGDRLKPAIITSAATAACVGIATCNCADEQRCTYQTQGNLTFNAVLTKGSSYYVSNNAGGISPFADLGSGDFVTYLGTATSTTVLAIQAHKSGIAIT